MEGSRKQTIAVVGLGAMGVVGVKNLLEEGFEVAGFERSGYVGGLWHFTEDEDTLSVLESTQTNVSSDKGCYTDFPFPNGTAAHCSARQVEEYIESYVDHFDLRRHFRLNTTVERICREGDDGQWRLDLKGQPSQLFDKVLLATGPHVKPTMPKIEGSESFTGRIIHSKAFKRPDAFTGMRVVVLGLGNTGGDICDALIGHASSIYVSHNHGAVVAPREINGVPLTHRLSRRFFMIQGILDDWLPRLSDWLSNRVARKFMRKLLGPIDPAWRLQPGPSVRICTPVISETLIPNLRSGAVRSVPGIRRVCGPREVELRDGQRLEADAIICCTGYENSFDVLESRFDPASDPPQAWLDAPGSKGRALPRLYRNVFSLEAPDSLAFLGCAWFVSGALCLADITSMCIAQVWAGNSELPGRAEMDRWVRRQETRICGMAHRGTPIPASVHQREWLVWADETAGMGMEEHLGWGWTGWMFWWRDRRLYKMLMDGVLASASWRVFEGRRKPWPGARAELERLNSIQRAGEGTKDE